MSLLDEARDARRSPGSECGVAIVRATLDAPTLHDFEELLEAVVDRHIQYKSAARALKQHQPSIDLSADTLSRHARRECKCH
jgi:hypothetical protein